MIRGILVISVVLVPYIGSKLFMNVGFTRLLHVCIMIFTLQKCFDLCCSKHLIVKPSKVVDKLSITFVYALYSFHT